MRRCPISMHHCTWRTSLRLEKLTIFLDLCRTMYPLYMNTGIVEKYVPMDNIGRNIYHNTHHYHTKTG